VSKEKRVTKEGTIASEIIHKNEKRQKREEGRCGNIFTDGMDSIGNVIP